MNHKTSILKISLVFLVFLNGCCSSNVAEKSTPKPVANGYSSGNVAEKSTSKPVATEKCSCFCSTTEEQKPLEFKLSYNYRHDGNEEHSQPLTQGSKLYSGYRYEIQFTPAEESYVYIYQVDGSNNLLDLMGMSDFDHKVKAGEKYTFPGKGRAIELDEVIGTETIHFLACKQPHTALEDQYKAMLQFREEGNKVKADSLQSSVLEEFNKRTKVNLVEGALKLCRNCINSLTFEHLALKKMQSEPSSNHSKKVEEVKQPKKEVKP